MDRPLIIGITGGSGSGKTRFINGIQDRFPTDTICLISQDDYYLPRHNQEKDAAGIHNFDRPESIDATAFVRDVRQLMRGETITRTEYTYNNELAQPRELLFKPSPIIIVEGLFVFYYPEMQELLDLKIFIHAKENLKVIRRIKRDRVERNYPLEDVLYRYEHHVLPAFERYIRPFMDESDLVINNNDHFEMGLNVIIGFIRDRLQGHQPCDHG
jgi:uridine kinase